MKIPTGLSIAAPAVVFGLLFVAAVHPQRTAWRVVESRVEDARNQLERQRQALRPEPKTGGKSALEEFDTRTATGEPGVLVADALETVVNSPAVGGVSNLSVETGASAPVPADSKVSLFPGTLMQMPVAIGFDARAEQIGRFFANLRAMPTTFELRSIEVTPSAGSGGLMHARAELAAFYRPAVDPATSRVPLPQMAAAGKAVDWPRPIVSSILFSSGRRSALVDGRIVGRGDRIAGGLVQGIEPEAVLIQSDGGAVRRVELARPALRMAIR